MALFLTSVRPVLLSVVSSKVDVSFDWRETLALVLILLIIALFFALALYSNMLRDEVSDCDAFESGAARLRGKRGKSRLLVSNPYSLSRVQFAAWTVIISCSFIYLALCVVDCTMIPLSQTALALMGIGAGVTTASAMIDNNEIQDDRPRHQNSPSEGFFIDILSDANGISLPRFQNVVWTVIAMVIYITQVYTTTGGCALPELSSTLLLLTGISSATYVAAKTNENSPANPAVPTSGDSGTPQNPVTFSAPPPVAPSVIPDPSGAVPSAGIPVAADFPPPPSSVETPPGT